VGGPREHLGRPYSAPKSESILCQRLVDVASAEGLISAKDDIAISSLSTPHQQESDDAKLQQNSSGAKPDERI
jgi:hypothetical protein